MEKRLKVLIITNAFPNNKEPNRGIFVKQSTIELANLCDVQVIAPVPWFPFKGRVFSKWSCSAEILDKEEINGIKIHHPRWLVIPKVLRSMYGFFFFFSVLPLVSRIRRQYDFDIIFGPWIYPDGFASVLLSRILKKPVVLQALGCDVNLYTNYFLRRQIIKWALSNSDKIVAVSRSLKENIIELGIQDDKVVFVPNGVDTAIFMPMNQLDCRNKLNLSADQKIILFVGSLEEVKGVMYLIDAFKKLTSTSDMDVHLFMVGIGSLGTEIRTRINELSLQDKVTLVGEVAHQNLPLWMNAGDLLCLPSIREGMPNVVLEALGCRKPVVASRIGGIPDMITSEDLGRLVEPCNAEALKDAFLEVLGREKTEYLRTEDIPVSSWQEQARLLYNELAAAIRAFRN